MLEKLRNFLIVTDPEPHRRTFLKPFHKNQTSEFCAACHKMTVDAPPGQ